MRTGLKLQSMIVLLQGLLLVSAGCCSFGNRPGQMQASAARELTMQGLAALHRGRVEEATPLLRQACAASPEDPRVRRHLATALVEQNEVPAAIEQMKLAIEQSPDDPALHVELGRLYLCEMRPHAARQQADLALELDRHLFEAWFLKGLAERSSGQLISATDSLHRAAVHDAENAEVRLELADTWLQRGEPLRALTALEIHNGVYSDEQLPMRAIELTGRALVELQQFDRSGRMLAQATERSDSTPGVWLLLSQCKFHAGDRSGALLAIRSARHAFPDNADIARWEQLLADETSPLLQASR